MKHDEADYTILSSPFHSTHCMIIIMAFANKNVFLMGQKVENIKQTKQKKKRK